MNVFHHIKIQDELQLLSEDSIRYNKFISTLGEGQRTECVFRSPQEIRTLQANRYLWFCYGFFVPDNFDSVYEAHEYFSHEYLAEIDVVDTTEQPLDEFLAILFKKLSTTVKNPIRIIQKDINIFEIHWVKSTTKLSKRMFWEHVEKIRKKASELNIIIPEPNQVELEQ